MISGVIDPNLANTCQPNAQHFGNDGKKKKCMTEKNHKYFNCIVL